MKNKDSLYKNTIIYSIGNFSSRALGMIMFPIYTYYLTTNDYGIYDIVITTISFLMPLITLQIPESLIRFFFNKEYKEDSIISSANFTILGNVITYNILFFIVNIFIKFQYFSLFVLVINSQVIFKLWMQYARAMKKNMVYSMASLIVSIVTLILNLILLVYVGLGIKALFLSMIGANITGIIFIELKVKARKYISTSCIEKSTIMEMLKFSFPLIPSGIIWWVMNSSDRYIIASFLGTSANGIYAIANKLPSIVIIIYGFYNLAWQDTAFSNSNDKNDEDINSIFKELFILLLTGSSVLVACSKIVIIYFVNVNYSVARYYIPILIIGTVFYCLSSFFGVAYRCTMQTQKELTSSIFGAILNIIINICLINMIGIWAATISTMISFCVVFIIRYIETKNYFKINLVSKNNLKITTWSICVIFLYYLDIKIVDFCLVFITIIIFFLINKNMLKTMFRSIRKKK